jgi:hypothetical protein
MREMMREVSDRHECVGCGYCCIRQTCTFGLHRHPGDPDRRCPELKWNGKRYLCGLMAETGGMSDFIREQLQAGLGCRSYHNPWRSEVRERTGEEEKALFDR